MHRGTTPTLTFTLPFNTNDIKKIWVTFSQNNDVIIDLDGERCTYNEFDVKVKLTQRETLSLRQNAPVEIQLSVLTNDETSLKSHIITTSVNRILKDGEI